MVKATTGVEPVNNGFADRRLTAWLRGLKSMYFILKRFCPSARDVSERHRPSPYCLSLYEAMRDLSKRERTVALNLCILFGKYIFILPKHWFFYKRQLSQKNKRLS